MKNNNIVAAIDIGGTNTRIAYFDSEYNIIDGSKIATDVYNPDAVIDYLINSIFSRDFKVSGIGITAPGPIDYQRGMILDTPNLPGFRGYELKTVMQNRCGVPVVLDNDANLAGLGESVFGSGKGETIVQFYTVSTGIGAGLVINQTIYHGARGNAMEIGNVIAWRNGPVQGNLKPGAIEAIASGSAIVKRALESGLKVKHAGEVNMLSIQGNKQAISIMEDAYEYLANTIAALYSAIEPNVIVLGGSLSLKIDGFCERLESLVKEKAFSSQKEYVKLKLALLGDDAGLYGAAYFANR